MEAKDIPEQTSEKSLQLMASSLYKISIAQNITKQNISDMLLLMTETNELLKKIIDKE